MVPRATTPWIEQQHCVRAFPTGCLRIASGLLSDGGGISLFMPTTREKFTHYSSAREIRWHSPNVKLYIKGKPDRLKILYANPATGESNLSAIIDEKRLALTWKDRPYIKPLVLCVIHQKGEPHILPTNASKKKFQHHHRGRKDAMQFTYSFDHL